MNISGRLIPREWKTSSGFINPEVLDWLNPISLAAIGGERTPMAKPSESIAAKSLLDEKNLQPARAFRLLIREFV